MTGFDNQGALMGNWHKCPNILTDRLVGEFVSPNAGWIILNVWRLTEGMNGRKEASIPTERFMNLLRIKKKDTAYKFVQEAVDSGLITVKKQRGIVNIYAINKNCSLWAIDSDVDAEIETTPDIGSTENGYYLVPKMGTRVVPKIGTGVVPKIGTLIKIKENIKENIKDSSAKDGKKDEPKPPTKPKTTIDKPSDLSQQIWDDLLTLRKSKRAPLSQTAWTPIANQIAEIQEKTGHSLDQIITVWVTRAWTAIKAEWYFNHISNNQPQQTNYQGNQNANHQSANNQHQPKQSSADIYAAKLAEQRRQRDQAANTAATGSNRANVYDMETLV